MSKISNLFKKKKKTLGFTEKPRTHDEINQEYNHYAVIYGHGAALIAEAEKNLENAHANQDLHLQAMIRLRAEGQKLPPEQPKTEEPKTDEPKPA